MNLQHVRYFVTLAERQNYKSSASALYITQPALTKAVQKLEEELGAPLFIREGKENHLSKFGKMFYSYAKKSLDLLDQGVEELQALSHKKKNQVRIGSISSCATQCVPISFSIFAERYPHVEFSCHQDDSINIIRDLIDTKIDIGLISEVPQFAQYNELSRVKLLTHRAIVALPPGHRFSHRNTIGYLEIIDDPIVQYNESCGSRIALEQELQSYGLPMPRNISVCCNAEELILSGVQKGLGIGFVSDTPFNRQIDVHYVELEDIYLYFPVYMVWKTNLLTSSIVQAYKDFVLSAHHRGHFSANMDSAVPIERNTAPIPERVREITLD